MYYYYYKREIRTYKKAPKEIAVSKSADKKYFNQIISKKERLIWKLV